MQSLYNQALELVELRKKAFKIMDERNTKISNPVVGHGSTLKETSIPDKKSITEFKHNSTNFEKVIEFHKTYQCMINRKPTLVDEETMKLRIGLIQEELNELIESIQSNDLIGIADALTDILYVTYGMGITYGINLDACFDEVHKSNMSKLDENGKPIRREDGKILKGPNYKPPSLSNVIENTPIPL